MVPKKEQSSFKSS